MLRRDFLKSGSLATAALWMPGFLKSLETPGAVPVNGRKLVIIQLSGGNDGLNTIIPVRNDIYYKERPRLGIKREQALTLTDEAGIHPALSGLKSLWDDGSMAILNSVGYPNPDRSHFRSMDIWHSGSPADAYWQTGWLGRYLDAHCAGRPAAALELDDTLSLALKGENTKGLAFQDVKRLYESTRSPYFADYAAAGPKELNDEKPVDYLYKTMAETLSSADYLFEQSKKRPSQATYPATGLGRDLKTIASLILADTNTSVYYASLGSFDTHINQDGQQKRLFEELNGALSAFATDMKSNSKWQEVLVVTFSEFGRRVAQNASGGTDHGTANNMMLFGGGLKRQGLLNKMPDLANLEDGDVKFLVDFRQVYATLLERWLVADAQKVLKSSFEPLSFV
ncbi:MAG: DUF1501 domain-containing protein [Chitinophagales bacterium]|nr:DUF1501 domain-containing protein [Chitinophagales bacterium]